MKCLNMAAFCREVVLQNRIGILSAIRAIELLLLSAGLIYAVVLFRGSFSTTSYDFLVSCFKKPVSILKSWLSSPLLICVLMNFIVILIALSSSFHHPSIQSHSDANTGDDCYGLQRDSSQLSPPQTIQESRNKPARHKNTAAGVAASPKMTSITVGEVTGTDTFLQNHQDSEVSLTNGVDGVQERSQREVSFIFSSLAKGKNIKQEVAWTMPEELGEFDKTKRVNEEVKTEDACDDKSDDTMEATWMAINGRTKPPRKQLKKSETWPQTPEVVDDDDEESENQENMAKKKEMRKSMTFNDTVTIRCRGGLRRDPSMNLEELNQRVEAFITNFNHEMRRQRQESDQRYLDMISQRL